MAYTALATLVSFGALVTGHWTPAAPWAESGVTTDVVALVGVAPPENA